MLLKEIMEELYSEYVQRISADPNALRRTCKAYLMISKKSLDKISKEMGISKLTLTRFIGGRTNAQYRNRCRMAYFLEKEINLKNIDEKK